MEKLLEYANSKDLGGLTAQQKPKPGKEPVMIFSRFGLPVEIIGAVTVEFVTDDPPQIWVACRVFDNEGYDREYAIWDLRADGGISEIMAAIDRSENGMSYQTDENPPD